MRKRIYCLLGILWILMGPFAQRANGVDSVLQLKVAHQCMKASNVTVVASDRQVHMSNVRYAAHPKKLNFKIRCLRHKAELIDEQTRFPPTGVLKKKSLTSLADLKSGVQLRRTKIEMQVVLDGVFTDGERIFFRIHLINRSDLTYQLRQFRTFLLDKEQFKRTAIQEKEFIPQWLTHPPDQVAPRTKKSLLFVLPKFTIPETRQLIIQIMEENGERDFSLKMDNGHLEKATVL